MKKLRTAIAAAFLASLACLPAFAQSVYQPHQFLGGPTSGLSAAFPVPRTIVASDLPNAGSSANNCSIGVTVLSHNVTFSLLDASGNIPSIASPCVPAFRNASLTNGSTVSRVVTSATTLTLNLGSNLGTQNNVPFKVWVAVIDTGSTAVLAASVQSNPTGSFPYPVYNVISSTACSACGTATSAGVFYSTVAQTNRPWTPIGFAEWGSGGLVTAGSWDGLPTTIQSFGPGVALPGQPIPNSSSGSTSAQTTNTGSAYVAVTGCAASLAPTMASNFVSVTWKTDVLVTSSGDSGLAALIRSGTVIGKPSYAPGETAFAATTAGQTWTDMPGSTSSATWTVNIKQAAGTGGIIAPQSLGGCSVVVQEIMG